MTSLVLMLSALSVSAEPTPAPVPADPPHVRQAVERSLGFLDKNKFNFTCITCHDSAWMIWSLNEADKRGFTVNRKSVDLIHARAVQSYSGHPDLKPTGMDRLDDLSVNSMYLTMAFNAGRSVEADTSALMDRGTTHLLQKQMADGHWQVNKNGEAKGPPLIDQHDSATLWAVLALSSREQPAAVKEDVAKSCAKALKWLKENPSSGTLQSAMLRVLVAKRLGTAEETQAALKELLAWQNADGGWNQVKSEPSDALGTGQALLALTTAGMTVNDEAIAKSWTFLLNSQKPDGSWYVRSRQDRPENKDRKQFRASSYMGTAWAVIGLVRSLPADPKETAAQVPINLKKRAAQKPKALDLYGSTVTDGDLKDLADFPELQTLDLGHTKVTDAGLKELAGLTQLQTLDLSFNGALTNAGLKELARLPQLQKLYLEGTAVTDAGLKELAEFKQLKVVQLGETKVTNKAIEEFRKSMPGVQISR